MAALGYEVDRRGLRITRVSLFTSGARYRSRHTSRERTMTITREQREAWAATTAKSDFNCWLDAQVKRRDGSLDLEKLYDVARQYGVDKRYPHLNPGQQRMNIGIMLRARVPDGEYRAQ